ncbi:Translation elongation factor P, partial [hydrothermal vent metagenome]
YAQMKLRNVLQGTQTDTRMRTEEKIERAVLEQVEMEYLYDDPAGYCFMNTENYEQVFLNTELLGDAMDYLLPNTKVKVEYFDEKPIGVELPRVVELKITETEPIMKTATITSTPKPATLETGKVVAVPQFISVGEKIRVDTAEGKYLERAK